MQLFLSVLLGMGVRAVVLHNFHTHNLFAYAGVVGLGWGLGSLAGLSVKDVRFAFLVAFVGLFLGAGLAVFFEGPREKGLLLFAGSSILALAWMRATIWCGERE